MAPTQQSKLREKMKAAHAIAQMQNPKGQGQGLGAEASMVSIGSTGNMSVIKEDSDYKSEQSKGASSPWVDPMEGPEGAAFRFMAQVEGYLSKEWKQFDRHMRYLAKGMAPGEVDPITGKQAKGVKVGVTVKQENLMNEMRQAVGLHINVKLMLFGLSALTLSLLAVTAFLWMATIDVQEQIDGYTTRGRVNPMETPTSLDLRLRRLTVPFGPTSTMCRSWKVNYTNDAHITAFEARSLGYPFGAYNPADKVVRTMSLWVSDFSVNATNDPADGANFACRKDAPAGAAGRLLWYWSRDAGRDTRFVLPVDVGVLLPGVAQLFLQVDYDVETGNADLRQLTSFDFWQEFEPFDESGIRIELTSTLRSNVATILQVGTMDLSVPKLAISAHNTTCHFSEESPNFRRGAELTVIAASTRTKATGTAVVLEVTRPHKPAPAPAPGAPPPPPGTPPPAPPPPPTRIWSSVAGGNGVVGTHGSDAPALPAHSGLNPRFSYILPTGQANVDGVEQQALTLKQGDVLTMQCSYNTRYGLPIDATGGWGRGHELCTTYLFVYPAADVLHPVCQSYALESVDFDGQNCTA